MVHHEHGLVPIPSPEVSELLLTVPTYSRGIPVELVTPVGAAIAATVVEGFGDMPLMRAEEVGYGAGHPRLDFPNLLRVVIGEEEPAWRRAEAPPRSSGSGEPWREHPSGLLRLTALPPEPDVETAPDALIETTVGDPGEPGRTELLERLHEAGASDAWAVPVIVRGGAAALRLSVIAGGDADSAVIEALALMPGVGPVHVSMAERRR